MTQAEKDSLRDYIISYIIANSQSINNAERIEQLNSNTDFFVIEKGSDNKYHIKKASSSIMKTDFRFDYESNYIQCKDLATGQWINLLSIEELANNIDLNNYVIIWGIPMEL